MAIKIIDTTKKTNEAIIIDSTKKDFVSSYKKDANTNQNNQPPVTESVQKAYSPPANISRDMASVFKDVPQPINEKESQNALKLFKNLFQTKLRQFSSNDLNNHNMIFFRYDAKFKDEVWDKTPLIFILRRSRGYTLGLNLHWTPIPLRLILIKLVFKLNKQAIKNNQSLKITYQQLKPILIGGGFGPVIRLYINKRMSRNGLVIPPEFWLVAANLHAETFTGGYSADALYAKASQDFAKYKKTKIKGRK